jgi:lipoprotein-anchoring transpeptidase ErfK/SrfK
MTIQMFGLKTASILTAAVALWVNSAGAAPLAPSYPSNSAALFETAMHGQAPGDQAEPNPGLAPRLQRQVVNYPTTLAAGTVVIDTAQTYLY